MNKLLYRVFAYMMVAIFAALIFIGSIHSSIMNSGDFLGYEILSSKELIKFYEMINGYTEMRMYTESKMKDEILNIGIDKLNDGSIPTMNWVVAIYDEAGTWAVGSDRTLPLKEAKNYQKKSESMISHLIVPAKIPKDYYILPSNTKDNHEIFFVLKWDYTSYKVVKKFSLTTYKIQMLSIGIMMLLTFVPVAISLAFGYLIPLKRLQNAANSIAAGQLSFNIKSQGLDEIKALSHSFEHMRYELEESNKREQQLKEGHRRLITSMSHDLRTPITSIKGYVEGLLDGKGKQPQRMDRYLRTIQSKTIYLDRMINDLFLFSQLDLGEYTLDCKIWDSVEALRILMEPIQLSVEDAGWTFKMETPIPKSIVYLDLVRVSQVIDNIVQNSLKYGEENGTIIIKPFIEAHYFAIAIIDTGMGISQEALPYVFEAFFREDSSRSHKVGGSGLGLAICKKIMELHKGRIAISSELGKGTAVTLYFSLGHGA